MRGKGEGSIFKDGRGLWTATIELPASPSGDRRRKTIRRKSKLALMAELKSWRARFDKEGDLPTRSTTLEAWMSEWFETVAQHNVRPKTAMAYKSIIKHHIIPSIGSKSLDKLTAADVRAMTNGIVEKGLSGNTALQAHRILAVALKQAVIDGRAARNATENAKAPRRPRKELQALTVEEGIRVLHAAASDPLGSLWAAVLLTGARQGELLGLELDRVSDYIDVSWQMQRLTWQHGCNSECGWKRGHDCPKRRLVTPVDWEHRPLKGGLWLSRPKSHSGWRIIPLVEPLASILRRHLAATADQPNPHGLVWHHADGSPIDPKHQSKAWHALLKSAGVPDVRLHDGRHTTVDMLYEAGVPEDVIAEIVGHSTRAQTRSYKARGNQKRLTEAMHQLSAMFTPTGDTPVEVER
jgi:integrase